MARAKANELWNQAENKWARHINQKDGTGSSIRPVPERMLNGTEMRRSSKNITEFVRKLNELTRELAEFLEGTS